MSEERLVLTLYNGQSIDTGTVATAEITSTDDEAETSHEAVDSQIDHSVALAYWSGTEATLNGMLGGYPQVTRVDLQGSSNFLAKLRRESTHFPPGRKLRRAVDCGAGIGRVTDGLLSRVAEKVDIVEPVRAFTDKIVGSAIGNIYNVGLEDWHPDRDNLGPYDLIWNQWCLMQLTDQQLTTYLKRLPAVLSRGGWIVAKENILRPHMRHDEFDALDSTVTRTDRKLRGIFRDAGLDLVFTELQRGMPAVLYPVRTYALQPKRKGK